jgi:delta8-fatty-acid desaturase
MKQRGMFTVSKGFYSGLCCWLALLFGSSLYMSLACISLQCHMAGAVLLGVFWQQAAGLLHDMGHDTVSGQWDHMIASLCSCVFGASTAWWKQNHNVHHVVANSIENDPDIQHMPFFAVSEKILERPFWSSYYAKWVRFDKVARLFLRFQDLLFFPLMMVARVNLYAQSWIFLLNKRLKSRYGSIELLGLSAFAYWYISTALSMNSALESAAWVLISHVVSGLTHVQIVLSHWAMEHYKGHAYNDASDDWYRLQLKTTMNIACPAWLDWLHVGLQFQIEHHLFPRLPRHNLRQASRMVQQVCLRHGIPYHSYSFFNAVKKTLDVLHETAALAQSDDFFLRNGVL